MIDEQRLLARITVNPEIFGGKLIIRGRRLAVEHVLSMLATGDTADSILECDCWVAPLVGNEAHFAPRGHLGPAGWPHGTGGPLPRARLQTAAMRTSLASRSTE